MEQSVKEILADDFWIMPATPEYIDEGVPYITSKNIKNGIIDFTKVNYISQDAYESISKNRPILVGDILISMIGTLGETAEVKETDGSFYGQNMFLVRLDESKVNKRYFLYFFKSNSVKRALEGKQNQSTQKYLKANHIENLTIPMPSLDEQKLVAEQLDKLSQIIALRSEELKHLDELIKARFVELFKECNNYELLGDADILISDGNYSSKYPTADEFVEEGVPFIRASNMVDNTITDDEMYHISAEKHAELVKGHVKPYDVLIATRGAGIGKIAVVPERHNDSNVNAQIVLLRCNKEKYNPLYLSWYLKLQDTQIKIQGLISGSAQPQLPIKRLVQLELLRPDIEKQNDFADFVHQVDKSKVAVQNALDETQLLFDSLMQQYFG